ncbi:MAG: cation transporter [Anaerolineae bacterium]|nr:cation transporter [Anaerolineae bacterium]
MVKQQFKIQGMHCVGCAMMVDGAVEDLPGVKSASTNYKRQVAVVEYDERQVSETDILQAIHEAGYSGKVAEAN